MLSGISQRVTFEGILLVILIRLKKQLCCLLDTMNIFLETGANSEIRSPVPI